MLKLKTEDRDIWFTADTHYMHKNIVRGESDWEDLSGCRPFETKEEMNAEIVDGINKYVKKDDILFFLGDWSFGGFDNIEEFRKQLDVDTIHFILGNHDHHVLNDKNGIRSLFTSVENYRFIDIDGQGMALCHYPIISWERAYRHAWMIHGHTHNMLPHKDTIQWSGDKYWLATGKMFDIGMDSAYANFGEYRPFKFQELKEILKDRAYEFVDKERVS